jgi:hypothetical protein
VLCGATEVTPVRNHPQIVEVTQFHPAQHNSQESRCAIRGIGSNRVSMPP